MIEDLPCILQKNILKYLDARSLCRYTCTHARASAEVKVYNLWKKRFKRDFPIRYREMCFQKENRATPWKEIYTFTYLKVAIPRTYLQQRTEGWLFLKVAKHKKKIETDSIRVYSSVEEATKSYLDPSQFRDYAVVEMYASTILTGVNATATVTIISASLCTEALLSLTRKISTLWTY